MAWLPNDAPFVLLDDASGAGGTARLYRDPVETITTDDAAGLEHVLDQLDGAAARGLHAAGWLGYEAGRALVEPDTFVPPGRLGWFGLFDRFDTFAAHEVEALLPDPAAAWICEPRPAIDAAAHSAHFSKLRDYILAGDIYQANLTFAAELATAGPPAALYAKLRPRARAGHGALLFDGEQWLLSFSPELFFSLHDGLLTARPMKGTARRMGDAEADRASRAALAADPKQRAENLMIVDLLRNDFSRIAVPGSVAVPELFVVETYPTVHQMVSSITAQIMPDNSPTDVLRAAFPCGSITGAPKHRAMEIIAEVERSQRGAYCGSIGRIDADGSAAFNVAIRTLLLPKAEAQAPTGRATLGLGSGIVADSSAGEEWRECLAKGEFARVAPGFDLIETMRFEPAEGILRLDRHLARLGESARTLEFALDRHAARNALHAACFRLDEPTRIRLLLSRAGHLALEMRPAPPAAHQWRVAIVPLPVDPGDVRLRHKTSARDFYDDARREAQRVDPKIDEILFVGPDGLLTEGSITSLFVARGDGLVTPPLALGLVPGVLRAELIEQGRAVEGEVRAADLAGGFLCGNSLRGLIPATLVANAGRLA